MKRSIFSASSLAVLASSHPLEARQYPTLPKAPDTWSGGDTLCASLECKQNALAFAFTYGFPLYPFGATIIDKDTVPTNFLIHQRELVSADEKAIVRPNADTLYTNIFYDISTSDLEITVPDFKQFGEGRFGVWPFYDQYGDNFANIGTVSNITHGKFLVKYDLENIGVFIKGAPAGYDGWIGMGTTYGIGINRIEVTNTTEDIEKATQIQDQMKIAQVPRNSTVAPRLDLDVFKRPGYWPSNNTSIPQAVLHQTAYFAPYNLPKVAEDRPWVNQTLENAGMRHGIWTQPPGTNLSAAVGAANASVEALFTAPGTVFPVGKNWALYDDKVVGDFENWYQARYFTAGWGYLAVQPSQAVYPSLIDIDSVGTNQALLFEFSGRPTLKQSSFWSMTLYDGEGYFIPNELNRFALGDRSNLTFPDGSPLYVNGEPAGDDAPFKMLVQPVDVEPPANWTSNWLPAPSGGGDLQVTLRWYGATENMEENGDYVYPKVMVIDAIRA
ncbi:hypothetical protein EJ04DRAFT_58434 [Polyplosphaeria fusca]|uniref:DUF1254 domain-containing protein n=1 Tax=Polyplosphaeria fusca TaxID=682080 RepID=A0A9P4UYH8_9PLEO|nr:hypothetical protein EJ04DRAFT_58434 [Polyplosphaeria fusca]